MVKTFTAFLSSTEQKFLIEAFGQTQFLLPESVMTTPESLHIWKWLVEGLTPL